MLTLLIGALGLMMMVVPILAQRRRWRQLERDLIACYGEEQIKGLTVREVYVLMHLGLLRPIGGSNAL